MIDVVKFLQKIKSWIFSIREKWVLLFINEPDPGSSEWLIRTEIKYGGIVCGVSRTKVSSCDPRDRKSIKRGGMEGGDRMLHHGYAEKYAQFLRTLVQNTKPITLVEVGILMGTGLAIWCDLFPDGRILGFDIDLSHFHRNFDSLVKKGAFIENQPELYEFDQLANNKEYLNSILLGDEVDICIDDGLHSDEAILNTFENLEPFLSDNFVYFIEDNPEVHNKVSIMYPELLIKTAGELTIVYK